jgi:hypothetical protein
MLCNTGHSVKTRSPRFLFYAIKSVHGCLNRQTAQHVIDLVVWARAAKSFYYAVASKILAFKAFIVVFSLSASS